MSRVWSTATLFLIFALTSASVMADPLCWLRKNSPNEQKIAGPIQLDAVWRVFKLPKPFKTEPSIQYVHLLLKRTEFEFVELTNPSEHTESWNRFLPRNIKTNQVQLFDVRVHNNKLGWIDLVYSFTGSPTVNEETLASLGFANHPNKNQMFYPQGSLIDELHIRANHKVTVDGIWLSSPGYWKWPCRKWSEVPESEIMIRQQ